MPPRDSISPALSHDASQARERQSATRERDAQETINALQRDVQLAQAEASFHSAVVVQRLEGYFRSLNAVVGDRIDVMDGDVLLAARDKEVLELNAELASGEARLITVHTEATAQLEECQTQLAETLSEKAALFRSSQVSRLECAALRADGTSAALKIDALEMTLKEQSHRIERQKHLHSQALKEALMEAQTKISEADCRRIELEKSAVRVKADRVRLQTQLLASDEELRCAHAERDRQHKEIETLKANALSVGEARMNNALKRSTAEAKQLREQLEAQLVENTKLAQATRQHHHAQSIAEGEANALRQELTALQDTITLQPTPTKDTPQPSIETTHHDTLLETSELTSKETLSRASLHHEWVSSSMHLALILDAVSTSIAETVCTQQSEASLIDRLQRCEEERVEKVTEIMRLGEEVLKVRTAEGKMRGVCEDLNAALLKERKVSAKMLSKIEYTGDELIQAERDTVALRKQTDSTIANLKSLNSTTSTELAHQIAETDATQKRLQISEQKALEIPLLYTKIAELEEQIKIQQNTASEEAQRSQYHSNLLQEELIEGNSRERELEKQMNEKMEGEAIREEAVKRHIRGVEQGHSRMKAERIEAQQKLLQIATDYENIIGTDTVGKSSLSRADATNRFMVKFRAWYRTVARDATPLASRSWSPPPPPPRDPYRVEVGGVHGSPQRRGKGGGERRGSGSASPKGGSSRSSRSPRRRSPSAAHSIRSSPLQAWGGASVASGTMRASSETPSL